jgi:hypothetical protein
MTAADKLRASARLVLRRQWDGRHFAGAVRAWEKLRGEDAPAEVHELAVLALWQGRDLAPVAIATMLHSRATALEGAARPPGR